MGINYLQIFNQELNLVLDNKNLLKLHVYSLIINFCKEEYNFFRLSKCISVTKTIHSVSVYHLLVHTREHIKTTFRQKLVQHLQHRKGHPTGENKTLFIIPRIQCSQSFTTVIHLRFLKYFM